MSDPELNLPSAQELEAATHSPVSEPATPSSSSQDVAAVNIRAEIPAILGPTELIVPFTLREYVKKRSSYIMDKYPQDNNAQIEIKGVVWIQHGEKRGNQDDRDKLYGHKVIPDNDYFHHDDLEKRVWNAHPRLFTSQLTATTHHPQWKGPGVPLLPELDIVKFDSFTTLKEFLDLTPTDTDELAQVGMWYIAINVTPEGNEEDNEEVDENKTALIDEELKILDNVVRACRSLETVYLLVDNEHGGFIRASAITAFEEMFEKVWEAEWEATKDKGEECEFWEIPDFGVMSEHNFAVKHLQYQASHGGGFD